MPAPIFTAETAVVLFCILLAPLAIAGLALINSGLGRARSAAHSLLASLCIFSVAAAAYVICGFAWQSYSGAPGHLFAAAGRDWNWLGRGPFFLRGMELDGSALSLCACLQIFSVGLAALIPVGACLDRWRLSAACASTALFAGWTYPLFAHWVWGGGWLAQLGANSGMGRGVVDAGGSGTIQAVGGLTALALAWILGPRRGKYSVEGMPMAIPGHNAVMILFGCLVTFVGWLGLNSAGALLFAGIAPGRVVLVSINTALAAGAAILAAAGLTRLRFGRPDVSISANGWVGGLVASSASCAFVSPVGSAGDRRRGRRAGHLLGGMVRAALRRRRSRRRHFGARSGRNLGIAGRGDFCSSCPLAAAGEAAAASAHDSSQWLAQIVAIATLLGFVLPLTYGLNLALDRIWPQRVAIEGERQGLDLYELGAGAYPEFVTHSEEFTQLR